MLGLGDFDKIQIEKMFQEIVQVEVDDGLQFLAESITVTDITKDRLYQGFRTVGFCLLNKAKIKIQIDLGVGDSVTPGSTTETIACVLGEDEAVLSAYPIYTAISEKWHAICKLGITNSRLKDYYDLYVIARLQNLSGEPFIEAVRNTFARRETEIIDELPLGISSEFYEDNAKKKAWKSFLTKNDLECEKSLPEICEFLEQFLHPVNMIIANDSDDNLHEWSSSRLTWS